MCGIHLLIHAADSYKIPDQLRARLCNRGPDHLGFVQAKWDAHGTQVAAQFASSVLSLRGDHLTEQPFVDAKNGPEFIFCWNGEAWKIDGHPVEGNDGEAVFELLRHAKSEHMVLEVLRVVEGPFVFIFADLARRRVYFGRDRLGRRSLLTRQDGGGFELSSVSYGGGAPWSEVEADGIYVANLDALLEDSDGALSAPTLVRHEWVPDAAADYISGIGSFNVTTPPVSHSLDSRSDSVRVLRERLAASLRLRVLDVPQPPGAGPSDPRIAVLFSGGLDCTVLARLSSDLLPPSQGIDLINVAFENPRVVAARRDLGSAKTDFYEECPDRMTGWSSFRELQSVCPGRPWRFVAVNVPYAETLQHKENVISLMQPHNTEMDLSIAYALYFAARGRGQCYTSPEGGPEEYRTPARVLLSGLGADELFGGYVRHATAFTHRGYPGVIEELKLDVSRLGKRNLGRDDRVMANWQREVRFPYLDETLVKWAIEVPVQDKCDFANPGPGSLPEAGKRILRLVAEQLGMAAVAREKKRAIQFGSRTAKMESGRVRGTTVISS